MSSVVLPRPFVTATSITLACIMANTWHIGQVCSVVSERRKSPYHACKCGDIVLGETSAELESNEQPQEKRHGGKGKTNGRRDDDDTALVGGSDGAEGRRVPRQKLAGVHYDNCPKCV
jgi:hypothetical protein